MLVNLFAVFNERDAERRLKAIAGNYTDGVIWTDPEGTTRGHEALNDRAQKLLDGLPGFVFAAAGPIHVSAIWAIWPSTWECRSSRRRSAATTSRLCAMA
jgi:hypothetical protein